MSKIKLLGEVEDGESLSEIRVLPHSVPQAHVAKGYTPLAPQKPRFNTSQDLKLKNLSVADRAPLVVPIEKANLADAPKSQPPILEKESAPILEDYQKSVPRRKNRLVRRLMVLMILIGAFAGILYSTHNYLRGRGILPEIRNPFAAKTGTANGDVFLRSTPNTTNPPVGLVSRNSRLKIVGSQDNWYEIDVIEYGRPKDKPEYIDHGWVSGKYIDMQE